MNSAYNAYMRAELENYIGEWIAIVDNEIVSHGDDIKKIYNSARRKYPGKRPLITKVPEKVTCIY